MLTRICGCLNLGLLNSSGLLQKFSYIIATIENNRATAHDCSEIREILMQTYICTAIVVKSIHTNSTLRFDCIHHNRFMKVHVTDRNTHASKHTNPKKNNITYENSIMVGSKRKLYLIVTNLTQ